MGIRRSLFANKVAAPVLAALVVSAGALFGAEANPDAKSPEPAPPRRLAPDLPLELFDFRVFQASPGKLDALHARLREHLIPLLEQHGIFTHAVFVPAGENPDQLVYLLTAAEGLGAMTEGWTGFREDPQWRKVLAETDQAGKLVAQESYQRLRFAYWSPRFPPEKPIKPGVYELRTYTCPDFGKHAALTRRFRDHTKKLFEKHGIQNIVYWLPDEEPDARLRLVYLLGHGSEEAAKKNFAAFRSDPDWLAVKKASEELAGGSLTNAENGVVSLFLQTTDYSPLK